MRNRLKVRCECSRGTARVWAGLSWIKASSPTPAVGARSHWRVKAHVQGHSCGNKVAPLLPLWEILDWVWQQTALLCLAAKFPHSPGSSLAFTFIPSPNEKDSVKTSGDQGERPRMVQTPAATPVTGPWWHMLADWACCFPPFWGHLPAILPLLQPKPAHSSCRRDTERPAVQGEAAAKAIVFQPPGYGCLREENPASAASSHKINRRGTEKWTFGELLSRNFSFSQCVYLLLSKLTVLWRDGCAAPWHPATD